MCIVDDVISCRMYCHYSLNRKKRKSKIYREKEMAAKRDNRKRMKGTKKDEMRKKKNKKQNRKRRLDDNVRDEDNFKKWKKRQDMIKICNTDPNSEHYEKYVCSCFV